MVAPSYAARVPGELTVQRAGDLFAGLLPEHGRVRAVSRFAEGSVTGAYLIEFAGAGSVSANPGSGPANGPRPGARASRSTASRSP
jgi:hypothetical protein